MSDHTTVLPAQPPEPQPAPRRRGRAGLIAVVASVVAVVLIAGGGFALWRLLSGGGPRPAEVLPASTLALASVDLDPSGGQKVEAIRTLRKFPAFRENTGITPDSDVLESIFDRVLAEGDCSSLTYERDVKPWIGQRAGVGVVDLGGDVPSPVFVLQVSDADNARTGFEKLADCSGASEDDEFGWTVAGDYVVGSDSTDHAKDIVAEAEKSPLAEDAAYQRWTDEVGGDGIVNVYVGAKVGEVLGEQLTGLVQGFSGADPFAQEPGSGDDLQGQLDKALDDFEGAAASLRFDDGGIDLSVATSRAKGTDGSTVSDHVGALPEDTAALLAGSIPAEVIDRLEALSSEGGPFSLDEFLGETGLAFPDDLVTVLGDSLSVSLGGDAPAASDLSGPQDLPVGLLVRGDTEKIQKVIDKVQARTGQRLEDLPATVETGDGKLAVATTPEYAEELVADGSLEDSETFQDAVSHADDALAVGYLAFSEEWLDVLRDLAQDGGGEEAVEVVDNLAEARALGLSAWTEDKVTHGLLRLSVR